MTIFELLTLWGSIGVFATIYSIINGKNTKKLMSETQNLIKETQRETQSLIKETQNLIKETQNLIKETQNLIIEESKNWRAVLERIELKSEERHQELKELIYTTKI